MISLLVNVVVEYSLSCIALRRIQVFKGMLKVAFLLIAQH